MPNKLSIFIHQPDFLPWIGFFQKLKKCDIFVVLDDVQFIRRGWINRDRILINNKASWLTVPVKSKGQYEELIKNIMIDYSKNWVDEFSKTIFYNYHKYPYYERHGSKMIEIFQKKKKYLIDLNMELIEYVSSYYKINRKIIFSSSLKLRKKKGEKILEILKLLNANEYITGSGSKDYLDEKIFEKENIKLNFHNKFSNSKNDLTKLKEDLSIFDYMLKTNKNL
jgi:hypothetical protein